jgi:hypothetical protein
MQSKTTPYALTDGATIAVNWNNGVNQYVSFAGSRTFTFSNGVAGSIYSITITQAGSGSYTATWPSTVEWPGGTAVDLTDTVGRTDQVFFYFDGTYYYQMAKNLDFTLGA